jgi:class 3 adenylate cyclase
MHSASTEDVRHAHISDVEAQERFGVKYIKYWFDEKRGTICCLVDAPSAEACQKVHQVAHGMLADEIIEVEAHLLAAFLGEMPVDDIGAVVYKDGLDGAFRTIMFTDIVGSTALTEKLGDAEAMRRLDIHNGIIRGHIAECRGREVKHTGDGFLAAFMDSSVGVDCALRIQATFDDLAESRPDDAVSVRIGMSAGEPVASENDLYGAAVNLAARVCDQAGACEIFVASVVRDLCIGKKLSFRDRGEATLKGFSEAVRLFSVVRP